MSDFNNKDNIYDVVVIGGGITGLALAWNYKKQGKHVAILEKQHKLGGAIQTETKEGYLLELGPNTILTSTGLLELIKDLDLTDAVILSSSESKKRYLVHRRTSNTANDEGITSLRLQALPTGVIDIFNNPLFSAKFFAELLRELFVKKASCEDESVRDFFVRRFGICIADYFVSPLLSGIWAADISQLSMRSSLNQLWKIEQNRRSIIIGAILDLIKQHHLQQRQKKKMISFKKGVYTIIDKLSSKLNGCIFTASELLAWHAAGDIANLTVFNNSTVSQIRTRKLVLTTEARETARLLEPSYPIISNAIKSIPYAPIGIVHLGLQLDKIRHKLDGFGFLIPPVYQTHMLGCLFSSVIFERRAPDCHALITCFSGGMTSKENASVEDDTVIYSIKNEIKHLLGISGDLHLLSRKSYKKALPNYQISHHVLQQQVENLCKNNPLLAISANWLSGLSVANRIDAVMDMASLT